MKLWIASLLLLFVVVVVRGAPQSGPVEPESPPLVPEAVRSFNRKLYQKLSKDERGNFVYSPYSIHMAFSLISLGAPFESSTRQELIKFLELSSEDESEPYLESYKRIIDNQNGLKREDGVEIKLANRLFASQDLQIKKDFVEKIEKFYASTIKNVDFTHPDEAIEVINQFVNDQTNGIIPTLFEQGTLDALSKLVLVNAIYFKGQWKFPFDAEKTKPMTFRIDEKRTIEYPHGMSLTQEVRTAYINELNADILELPYESGNLVMIIVLPKDTDIDSLDGMMGRFDTTMFEQRLDDNLDFSEVEVTLPRFESTFDWEDLSLTMKKLGVETIFDEDKANLTNISDDPLYVSKAIHKAVIKVNEEGSEASAATGVAIGIRVSGGARERKTFIVDRPFIFYIYDKNSNLPIFVGRIVDPSGKSKLDEDIVTRSENPSTNCTEEEIAAGNETIGFPCKGSDLNHIKENKEQNAEAEDARRNHFQNKNNNNNETSNDNIDETDNDNNNKTEMFE